MGLWQTLAQIFLLLGHEEVELCFFFFLVLKRNLRHVSLIQFAGKLKFKNSLTVKDFSQLTRNIDVSPAERFFGFHNFQRKLPVTISIMLQTIGVVEVRLRTKICLVSKQQPTFTTVSTNKKKNSCMEKSRKVI